MVFVFSSRVAPVQFTLESTTLVLDEAQQQRKSSPAVEGGIKVPIDMISGVGVEVEGVGMGIPGETVEQLLATDLLEEFPERL